MWHASVIGLARAVAKLEALGRETLNECFATDLATQEIIGRVNEGRAAATIFDDDGATAN
jgi:hypothetical protein